MRKLILSFVAVSGLVALYSLFNVSPVQPGQKFLWQATGVDRIFANWAAQNGRSYSSKEEYERRREIFEQ